MPPDAPTSSEMVSVPRELVERLVERLDNSGWNQVRGQVAHPVHAPQPTVRKVIVEFSAGNGWLAMDEDGNISGYPNADTAIAAIRRADRKAPGGFQVTLIEWIGTPDGWDPPP